jgi:hypothetical protein
LFLAQFLSPESSAVHHMFGQWQRGESLNPMNGELPTDIVARVCMEKGLALLGQQKQGPRAAGRYLVEMALAMDPADPVVSYKAGEARIPAGTPGWPKEVTEAAARFGNAHRQIRREQSVQYSHRVRSAQGFESSVNCLVVRSAFLGPSEGGVLVARARARLTSKDAPAQVIIAGQIGESMKASLQDAYEVLRYRYPVLPKGLEVVVSFDDQKVPVDGASASVGFTLLLFSVFDGIEIDPKVAITGKIGRDWKVEMVGGVPQKMAAALDKKCRYLIVPIENTDALSDLLADGVNYAAESIQLIGVRTFEEAVALARRDRAPEIQGALDAFEQAVKLLGEHRSKGSPQALRKAYESLQNVLKTIPTHESARAILRSADGHGAAVFSLERSAELLQERVFPWVAAGATVIRQSEPNETRAARTKTGLEQLRRLQPQINPRLARVAKEMEQFLEDCYRYDTQAIAAPSVDRIKMDLERIQWQFRDVLREEGLSTGF